MREEGGEVRVKVESEGRRGKRGRKPKCINYSM